MDLGFDRDEVGALGQNSRSAIALACFRRVADLPGGMGDAVLASSCLAWYS